MTLMATIPSPSTGLGIAPIVLRPDLARSSVALYEESSGVIYAVVSAESLRFERMELFREADGDFGICLVTRLTGHAPAIGIIRRSELGFREYWRTIEPEGRDLIRRLHDSVQRGCQVPVFWRLADGRFAEFALGGWRRQHRVWYSRLDVVDHDERQHALQDTNDPNGPLILPLRFGAFVPFAN